MPFSLHGTPCFAIEFPYFAANAPEPKNTITMVSHYESIRDRTRKKNPENQGFFSDSETN